MPVRSQAQIDEVLRGIRGLVVDIDGVLHVGEVPSAGLAGFLAFLESWHVPHVFVTNNSTRSIEAICGQLAEIGVPAVAEQVITSSAAAAADLARRLPAGSRVYAVGESGLEQALQEAGLVLADEQVAAVVVGLDRRFGYEKIRRAASAIAAGAQFVACNTDSGAPSQDGIAPGSGAMVAAIQAVCKVAPRVVGKPQPAMFLEAAARMGLAPAQCAAIGDHLEVDVVCAKHAGMTAILVLSGMTGPDRLAGAEVQPDLIFEHVGQLAKCWQAALRVEK